MPPSEIEVRKKSSNAESVLRNSRQQFFSSLNTITSFGLLHLENFFQGPNAIDYDRSYFRILEYFKV